MSKMAAIDAAVRLQMANDGKQFNYLEPLEKAAPSHALDGNSLERFLLNVSNRLRLDDPKLIFDWKQIGTDAAMLSKTPVDLINHIALATNPEPPPATAPDKT